MAGQGSGSQGSETIQELLGGPAALFPFISNLAYKGCYCEIRGFESQGTLLAVCFLLGSHLAHQRNESSRLGNGWCLLILSRPGTRVISASLPLIPPPLSHVHIEHFFSPHCCHHPWHPDPEPNQGLVSSA